MQLSIAVEYSSRLDIYNDSVIINCNKLRFCGIIFGIGFLHMLHSTADNTYPKAHDIETIRKFI